MKHEAFEEMKPTLVTPMPVMFHCASFRVPVLEQAVEMNVWLPWFVSLFLPAWFGQPLFPLWLRWGCDARKESRPPSGVEHGSICLEGRWRKSRTTESLRCERCLFQFLFIPVLYCRHSFSAGWHWKFSEFSLNHECSLRDSNKAFLLVNIKWSISVLHTSDNIHYLSCLKFEMIYIHTDISHSPPPPHVF